MTSPTDQEPLATDQVPLATAKVAEPVPPGQFEAAAAGYHRRVGDALGRYQRRCDELGVQYAQAIAAAYQEPTAALIQQKIDAANEETSKELSDLTKATNFDVEQSLRIYLHALKNAWADLSVDDTDLAQLARVGQDLWFIANAANGAFPPVWWAGAGGSIG